MNRYRVFRPQLECLEDRCVLSTLQIAPPTVGSVPSWGETECQSSPQFLLQGSVPISHDITADVFYASAHTETWPDGSVIHYTSEDNAWIRFRAEGTASGQISAFNAGVCASVKSSWVLAGISGDQVAAAAHVNAVWGTFFISGRGPLSLALEFSGVVSHDEATFADLADGSSFAEVYESKEQVFAALQVSLAGRWQVQVAVFALDQHVQFAVMHDGELLSGLFTFGSAEAHGRVAGARKAVNGNIWTFAQENENESEARALFSARGPGVVKFSVDSGREDKRGDINFGWNVWCWFGAGSTITTGAGDRATGSLHNSCWYEGTTWSKELPVLLSPRGSTAALTHTLSENPIDPSVIDRVSFYLARLLPLLS